MVDAIGKISYWVIIWLIFLSCSNIKSKDDIEFDVDMVIDDYIGNYRNDSIQRDIYYQVSFEKMKFSESVILVSIGAWSRPYSNSKLPFKVSVFNKKSDKFRDVVFFYSEDSISNLSKEYLFENNMILGIKEDGLLPSMDYDAYPDQVFWQFLVCLSDQSFFLQNDGYSAFTIDLIPENFDCPS